VVLCGHEGYPEWENYEVHLSNKGDTFVGNDVWFGHESVVVSAVNVGDGAIIAVVTKDVLPYTIVAGNPARPIRRRFSDEVIDRLTKIQWWNWEYEKITRNIKAIVGADIQAFEEAK
jgi:virginiamycin A acetyltransferase